MTVEQYIREKYLHDINNHPRYEEPEELVEIEDADEIPWPPLPKDTKILSLDELEG